MKKISIVGFFVVLCMMIPQFGQAATWTKQGNAGISNWFSVASSSDGMKLVASDLKIDTSKNTTDSYLYTSNDGGATWTKRVGGEGHSYGSLALSSDGKKILAIDTLANNSSGHLYISTDGGATWTNQSGPSATIGSVKITADGQKITLLNNASLDSQKRIWTSLDNGATWTPVMIPTVLAQIGTSVTNGTTSAFMGTVPVWQYLRAYVNGFVSVDGTRLVAFETIASDGKYGYMYSSSDSGATWTKQTSVGAHGWFSMASSADESVLVATAAKVGVANSGSVGPVVISNDKGATWSTVDTLGLHNWTHSVVSKDGSHILVEADDAGIFLSSDRGLTWTKQIVSGNHKWWSFALSENGSKIVAADWNGYVYTASEGSVVPDVASNSNTKSEIGTSTSLISKTLSYGQTDSQVTILQNYLINHGYLSGNATGFYGAKTKNAVLQFQNKFGIIGGDGSSVGPKTRAMIGANK